MVGFVVVGLDGSGVNLGQGTGVGTGRKWGLTGDGRGGSGQVTYALICALFSGHGRFFPYFSSDYFAH